jgi:uncharacterized protein YlxW (UPF0749 family)
MKMGGKSSEQRLNLMAPDCQSPQCHEAIRLALEGKVSKRTLWISLWAVFIAVFLPLVGTGIKVWSQQENNHYRFAEKTELVDIDKRQTELKISVNNIKENIQDIKKNQEETQKDVKEILRHLRDIH